MAKRGDNIEKIGSVVERVTGENKLSEDLVRKLVAVSAPKDTTTVDAITAPEVLDRLIYQSCVILQRHERQFQFDQQAESFLKLISCYFSGDDRAKNFFRSENHRLMNNWSFKKGLLLAGSTGLGKSLTMRAAAMAHLPGHEFTFNPCNNVVSQYETDGPKKVQSFFQGIRCFDDFGTEPKAIWYGKHHEFFRIVLEARYNAFIHTGLITHITTNLTIEDIGKRYGAHIESRLYEQFNIIVMAGTDRRKSTNQL